MDPKLHCYTIGKSPNLVEADRAKEGREEEGNPSEYTDPGLRIFIDVFTRYTDHLQHLAGFSSGEAPANVLGEIYEHRC